MSTTEVSQATTIVGLEVHVQLLTESKLFCGCANRFNPDHPNVQTCPVCLGLPGALPVLNEKAIELSAKVGLALNCEVSRFTKWDRKQYYYPDLPKAYQISQYDLPICHDGYLDISVPADDKDAPPTERRVRIIRAHLEEDAGKNMHDESGRGGDSRVDLNRCGTPLLEIVSEPDIRSAEEAKVYLEELRLLLTYLGVSDCNMQEGSLRCDANVNLHVTQPDGTIAATPIVEVKNLNSFRGVEAAIRHEEKRQLKLFEQTGKKLGDPGTSKETWGWDASRNITFEQRGKEEASDYRYFPDPDLLPVTMTAEQVDALRESLCERPADRRARFQAAYQLSLYDASVIIDQGNAFADYYETTATAGGDGKQAANWVTQDVLRELNDRELPIDQFPIPPDILGCLLAKVSAGDITIKGAREVFGVLLNDEEADGQPTAARIEKIIQDRGLSAVQDTAELEAAATAVLERNTHIIADVKAGKQQAVGPLIGQVMREFKGADAKVVRQMLLDKIDAWE